MVGSNGKSSTARFAAAALAAAGHRVGTYLSPHVAGWHERIEIDGAPVRPAAFVGAVDTVRAHAERLTEPVTQFEVLTAVAFRAFADAEVEFAVVEAGLGGRWDATNVFDGAAVVALTRIDLEHTALLGESIAEITGEKLAVVHAGGAPLLTGPLDHEAAAVVGERVAMTGVRHIAHGRDFAWSEVDGGGLVRAPRATYDRLPPVASFQRDNLALGLAAAETRLGVALPQSALRSRLGELRHPGRAEVASRAPLTILDGAHNPAAARALAGALDDLVGDRPVVLVLSLLDDKDLPGVLEALLPRASRVVATRSSHRRARDPRELADAARVLGVPADVVEAPEEALRAGWDQADGDGAVLVAGSLYLIEDLRRCGILGSG